MRLYFKHLFYLASGVRIASGCAASGSFSDDSRMSNSSGNGVVGLISTRLVRFALSSEVHGQASRLVDDRR